MSATSEASIKEHYKKFLANRNSSCQLLPLNESAIQRFVELGFPKKKDEMFTYVDLGKLASTDFSYQFKPPEQVDSIMIEKNIYEGCENSIIVMLDGVFQKDLSDISGVSSSLILSNLETSFSDNVTKEYLLKTIEKEKDIFSTLNSAFLQKGLMLEVKPHSVIDSPIQILHISSGDKSTPAVTMPRIFLKTDKMTDLKMIVKYTGIQENYFINAVQDVIVGEDSKLSLMQIQEAPFHSWNFSKTRVTVLKNGRFISHNISSGSRLTRHSHEVILKEEGAEVTLKGLSILTGLEQDHNYIRINHEAPNCISNQLFKTITDGHSRVSTNGTVVVNKGAQFTQSNQLINNLMLSDKAIASNKPNLMIFADDVKCTHGASTGQVDEEQLFYLNSRGLSSSKGINLLTAGFAGSIIDDMNVPGVVKELKKTLSLYQK